MLLSKVIEGLLDDFYIYEIQNEQEVETLGLLAMDLEFPFVSFLADVKYANKIDKNVKMVITKPEYLSLVPKGLGVYLSKYPRLSYFLIHNYLSKTSNYKIREDFNTEIGERCKISKLCSISEKNVRIGNNVIIEDFSTIKENTIIGDNTIIRSGVVVGGEGFEFKRNPDGTSFGTTHCGWVIVGENVEIQNNTCIDKAVYPWDVTLISDFCRIDNLVYIAHGVKLSKSVFIAGGASIAGRTIFGEGDWVGVGATVSNGLVIGRNSRINIGSVVTKDVSDNQSVSGNFAISHQKYIDFIKSIR